MNRNHDKTIRMYNIVSIVNRTGHLPNICGTDSPAMHLVDTIRYGAFLTIQMGLQVIQSVSN